MKKVLLTLLAALFMPTIVAHADEEGTPLAKRNPFGDGVIMPQSPDVWQQTRYGNTEVDLFHGTIGLSIPIYQYKDKDFSIPITLNYASSGFMPGRADGPVGMGWSISCPGFISREVRGLPDDCSGKEMLWKWTGDPNHQEQFFVVPDLITGRPYVYHEQAYGAKTHPTIFGFARIHQMEEEDIPGYQDYVYTGMCGQEFMMFLSDTTSGPIARGYETEPDVYHFYFMGHSGSFILLPDGQFSFFGCNNPSGEYEAEFTWDWTQPRVSSFTMKTGDGFVYVFGEQEYTENRNLCYSDSETEYCSAWKLTRVIAPNGRTVVLTYTNPIAESSYSGVLNVDHKTLITASDNPVNLWQSEGYDIDNPRVSVANTDVLACYLQELSVEDEVQILFTYTNGCLSSIVVRNRDEETVRSCDFRYQSQGSFKHVFLESFSISTDGRYSFSYYTGNDANPDRDTYNTDLYGYYTNNDLWTTRLPDWYNTLGDYAQSIISNRVPNAEKARLGMLKTIGWPAGGRTELEYEANDYSMDLQSQMVLAQDKTTAGLRIKRITSYDWDGKLLQLKDYKYETDTGRSSGILLKKPELYWKYQLNLGPESNEYLKTERECVTSSSPIGFGFGSHIEYIRVSEEISNGLSPAKSITTTTFHATMDSSVKTEWYHELPTEGLYTQDGWEMRLSLDNAPLSESVFQSGSLYAGKPTTVIVTDETGKAGSQKNYTYGLYSAGNEGYGAPILYIGKKFNHYYSSNSTYGATVALQNYDVRGVATTEYTTSYSVNGTGRINESEHVDSKGRTSIARTVFSPGFPCNPVRTERTLDNQYVSVTKVEYDTLLSSNGRHYLRPLRCLRAELPSATFSLSGVRWKQVASFDRYDARNNILQMTDSTGLVKSFVWDTGGQHPIAIGEGIGYDDLTTAIGVTGGSIQLNTPYRITRYEWIPLVGPSRITDPSGRSMKYGYDNDGRLVAVLDELDRPLEKYKYHSATSEPINE